jgi:hypothetical protein
MAGEPQPGVQEPPGGRMDREAEKAAHDQLHIDDIFGTDFPLAAFPLTAAISMRYYRRLREGLFSEFVQKRVSWSGQGSDTIS